MIKMKIKTLPIIISMLICLLIISTVSMASAQEEVEAEVLIFRYLGMSLSVSLCSIGAAYALGKTGTASVASITEKPELFGRTIIYVGMAEGIAIYGLLISFLIWIG
jgi:V/A-type H+-transporting ATPase subunit K